jgi:sporadic carbohydrate cluster protein (TIGR04323 family)
MDGALGIMPTAAGDIAIDPALEESLLTTWNAKVVSYDVGRFPFNEWVLGRIQQLGYPLTDLRDLHKVIPQAEQYKVSKRLCADTNEPDFRRMLNSFVRHVVVPKGKLKLPVAVQRFLNIRFMVPDRPESILPYHTGLLYGHGLASRSLWMPLTDVTADEDWSASMQIISTEKSRELVRYAVDNRLSCKEMTSVFGKESWPLKTGPGDICFFTQENIHGNVVNTTGKTRVSIDFRVAEAQHGDLLARKIPAGYFHIIHDTDEGDELPTAAVTNGPGNFDNGKQNTFYLNNNTSSTFGIPVHLQRYMLYEYCDARSMTYGYELFELEDMSHMPTLRHIIMDAKANAVLYSIFALPEDKADRDELLQAVIDNGLIMHFVNEDLVLRTPADLARLNAYLEFSKYGHSRMPIGLPVTNRSKVMLQSWITQ